MKKLLIFVSIAILTLTAGCGGSSGGGGGGGGSDYENIGAAANAEGTGAVMGDTDGNLMTVQAGSVTWKTPDGNDIVMYYGSDGYPTRAVIAGQVILFGGWDTTNNTVNIGMIQADGTTKTEHNVAVDADIMSRLQTLITNLSGANASIITSLDSAGVEKWDWPTISSAQLANAVQFGGTLFSAGLCGASIGTALASGGIATPGVALACASTAMYFASAAGLVGEDSTFTNATGGTLILIDAAQCAGGDPTACAGIVIEAAGTALESASDTQENLNTEIQIVEMGLPYGGGAVQVTLSWSEQVDIDLYVTDPDGETIYYGHTTSASGGLLDHDDRDGGTTAEPAAENIYWLSGAPTGTYTVEVDYYSSSGPATTYEIVISVDGTIIADPYTGTLTSSDPKTLVTTFTYPQ
ncbi:MAG: hypothetical protein ABH871_05720 [Pseudomonadota bacterium]